MLEDDCTIDEAEETLAEDEDRKIILYDKGKKGFYVNQYARHFDLTDIRLIAECIYSSKCIPQSSAERLADVILEYVSEPQAEKIRHFFQKIILVILRKEGVRKTNTLLFIAVLIYHGRVI